MAVTLNTGSFPNYLVGQVVSYTENTDGTATLDTNIQTLTTADHVGRLIYMTNGTQNREFRKITAVNGSEVTLDAHFSRHAFRAFTRSNGTAFPAGAVANGDTFTISVNMVEVATAAGADLTNADDSYFQQDAGVAAQIRIGADICIADEDITFSYDSVNFRLSNDSALILGYVNGNGTGAASLPYSEGGCTIIDVANAPQPNTGANTQNGTGDGNYGDVHFYGCNVINSGTRPFWRYYRDNTMRIRMFECRFAGSTAMRVRGETSLIVDCSFRGRSTSDLQKFNPTFEGNSFFGLVQGVDVNNADQGIYWWWNQSFSGTISGVSASQITDQLVFFNDSGQTLNSTFALTFSNSDLDNLESALLPGAVFARTDPAQGQNKSFILQNDLDINVIDSAGDALTGTTRLALEDNLDVQSTVVDTTTGTFATQSEILETIAVTDNTTFNILQTGNAANQRAPFTYGIHSDGFVPVYRTTSLRAPETNTFLAAPDLERTVISAAVANYTTLETAERAYDFQARARFDSPYVPAIDTEFFAKSGSTLTFDGNVTFTSTGQTLTRTGTSVAMNLGTETAFTGNIVSTTGAINLGNRRLVGSLTSASVSGMFTSTTDIPQAMREGNYAATGTVSSVLNIASNADMFIYFEQTTGHTLTINNSGTGTITVAGPTTGSITLGATSGITAGNGTIVAEGPAETRPTLLNIEGVEGLRWQLFQVNNGSLVEPAAASSFDGSALSFSSTDPGFVWLQDLQDQQQAILVTHQTNSRESYARINIVREQNSVDQDASPPNVIRGQFISETVRATAPADGELDEVRIIGTGVNSMWEAEISDFNVIGRASQADTGWLFGQIRAQRNYGIVGVRRNIAEILAADRFNTNPMMRVILEGRGVSLRPDVYRLTDLDNISAAGTQYIWGVYQANDNDDLTETGLTDIQLLDLNVHLTGGREEIVSLPRTDGVSAAEVEQITEAEVTSIVDAAEMDIIAAIPPAGATEAQVIAALQAVQGMDDPTIAQVLTAIAALPQTAGGITLAQLEEVIGGVRRNAADEVTASNTRLIPGIPGL